MHNTSVKDEFVVGSSTDPTIIALVALLEREVFVQQAIHSNGGNRGSSPSALIMCEHWVHLTSTIASWFNSKVSCMFLLD